jgi:hypothetical protein
VANILLVALLGFAVIGWATALISGLIAWRHVLRWRRRLPSQLAVQRVPFAASPEGYRREWTVLRLLLRGQHQSDAGEADRIIARRWLALSIFGMIIFVLAVVVLLFVQLYFAPWDLELSS